MRLRDMLTKSAINLRFSLLSYYLKLHAVIQCGISVGPDRRKMDRELRAVYRDTRRSGIRQSKSFKVSLMAMKEFKWLLILTGDLISRDFSVSCEDYKIDGKEWYHYFLCGYKVHVYIIWINSISIIVQAFYMYIQVTIQTVKFKFESIVLSFIEVNQCSRAHERITSIIMIGGFWSHYK